VLLEIPQTLAADQPRGSRSRPLAALHPLILEVCQATRTFPRDEPLELGSGLRGAALGAAEAVLQSCRCQDGGRTTALAAAASRLREVACCLEIARQLGYLQSARCAEIASLVASAHDSIWRQTAGRETPPATVGTPARPSHPPVLGRQGGAANSPGTLGRPAAPSASGANPGRPAAPSNPAGPWDGANLPPVPLQVWAARARRAGSLSQ
jgi:hypothetical protein